MKIDFSENTIAKSLLIAAIVLLLLRFVPALWGSVALLLLLAPIVGVTWWILGRKGGAAAKMEQDQLTRAIEEKMVECQRQSTAFRQEVATISQQYQELADQLEKAGTVDVVAHGKGKELLLRFNNEMDLRLAKATFFESSYDQLEKMLHNRRLQRKLEESEAALQQWQEANFDGVEALESMRERIRLDQAQLAVISELAQKAAISPNLQQAIALKKELEAMKLG